MAFSLGNESLKKLNGVHQDLLRVVLRAIQITEVDFKVLEGVRTVARQRQLVAAGKSKTMNSRHLTGKAVDLVPLPVDWNNLEAFRQVADAMKKAAAELGVSIEWGGDWKTFHDAPHFQLSASVYP